MSRPAALAFLILLAGLAACQRQTATEGERPSTEGSGAPLDRMQMASARRVALESATAAMNRGDLERLKQLDVWVRNRASVVIFEPDDLASLGLAIECLEHRSASASTLERLDAVSTGSLKQPARDLCERQAP